MVLFSDFHTFLIYCLLASQGHLGYHSMFSYCFSLASPGSDRFFKIFLFLMMIFIYWEVPFRCCQKCSSVEKYLISFLVITLVNVCLGKEDFVFATIFLTSHETACSQDDLSLLIFPLVTWLRQCSLGFSTMKSFFVPLFQIATSDGSPVAQTTLRSRECYVKVWNSYTQRDVSVFSPLMYVSLDLLVGISIDSSMLTSYPEF